jgi:hypothetical protein
LAVETPSIFASVIQDHLDLKRRNAELEGDMPIDAYRIEDPFENHPLFKTEEQARIEDTLDGYQGVGVTAGEQSGPDGDGSVELHSNDGLWGRSRDFDWGD